MAAHERVVARLLNVQAALANARVIVAVSMLHESAVGDVGYFRVRAYLVDGSEAKFMERFRHQADTTVIEKYSFHWQRADGSLIRRWDNAPHHPEIPSFPNVHVNDEARHARFPLPIPLPQVGEVANESLREFHINHVHYGDENNVLAHEAVDVFRVLEKIEQALAERAA